MAEETPVTATEHRRTDPVDDQRSLRVRRGRIDSVDPYEIKDSELDILEHDSLASLQPNFAIFLLSTAASTLLALSTATFTVAAFQTVAIVVSVVGIFGSAYLLLEWSRTKLSVATLCKRIRSRIPPENIDQNPATVDIVEDEDDSMET